MFGNANIVPSKNALSTSRLSHAGYLFITDLFYAASIVPFGTIADTDDF